MPNMVSKVIKNLGISVHTAKPPTNEEWQELITLMQPSDVANFRAISLTDGGAPNSAQRKSMNDYLAGRVPLSAVVTQSTVVRGVVTAMSWFNPNIKSFSPEELDAALVHLKVNRSEFALIKKEIRTLANSFGNVPMACIPKNL